MPDAFHGEFLAYEQASHRIGFAPVAGLGDATLIRHGDPGEAARAVAWPRVLWLLIGLAQSTAVAAEATPSCLI